MGLFSKRPHPDQDQHIEEVEEVKRRGGQLRREIYARIEDGTATKDDKRIWNAGRKRSGRIK
ncbi:hypothetical protein OYE22_16830 [Streptomyces sp. 71268]|uniref:hypothetical protein n=1 Tax=Streptomyces sp. 71268 TaxID=3002640 RepID=UPI0023F8292D|nr:hypothetical protein [Streptomyces sp. 71268]WEV26678.1 hypothetical protein OYE22_16830 [Streptomyces sp. 71268]